MSDLVEFLRARLDEDEEAARAAAAANPGSVATRWSAEQVEYRGTGVRSKAWAVVPERVKGVTIAIIPTDIQPRFTTHIARHDPARVLAEVEAKRRIIAEHYVFQDIHHGQAVQACRQCSDKRADDDPMVRADRWVALVPGPCLTLRLLALPHADHADYREEWRL